MQITIFGRNPALWIQGIGSLLGILVTLKFDWLTPGQAGAIVAVLTAGAGLLTALATRPVAVSAFTTLVSTVAVLTAAYGFEVPTETLGAIQLAVVSILTLIARGQITPAHDPRPGAGVVIEGELVR